MQAAGLVDTFNSSTQQLTLFAPIDTAFQTPLTQVSFGMSATCVLMPSPVPLTCCQNAVYQEHVCESRMIITAFAVVTHISTYTHVQGNACHLLSGAQLVLA